jgi:hypothetical protein
MSAANRLRRRYAIEISIEAADPDNLEGSVDFIVVFEAHLEDVRRADVIGAFGAGACAPTNFG